MSHDKIDVCRKRKKEKHISLSYQVLLISFHCYNEIPGRDYYKKVYLAHSFHGFKGMVLAWTYF
jgi:hypothetical protein